MNKTKFDIIIIFYNFIKKIIVTRKKKYFECNSDILWYSDKCIVVGGFVGRWKCKQDEIYTRCGALCQPTCAKPVYKGHCVKVGSVNNFKNLSNMNMEGIRVSLVFQICMPGCLCPSGKVRDTYGKCVPLSKCFRKGWLLLFHDYYYGCPVIILSLIKNCYVVILSEI